ncbi:MAG: Type 1 glutamine amidotransferase-like domain-containing protein [Candidatus Dojkabacteria bacterium]|nr:MAG: Type 1 glutamine amidotransferase-like domain-containing protein [Candidatus Dojkabacteria bacterium]
MKNLFLSSIAANMVVEFTKIFELNPVNTRVAFIPNAADRYPDPWFMINDKNALKKLGYNLDIIDLKEVQDSFLYDRLCKANVIFVAGGNTFDLLNIANESGFLSQCRGRVNDGTIYFGSSAGSVLAAKDISPIRFFDQAPDDMPSTKALSLVDFLPIPHLGNPKYSESFANLFKVSSTIDSIIAFTDFQSLLIHDSFIEIIEQDPLLNEPKDNK